MIHRIAFSACIAGALAGCATAGTDYNDRLKTEGCDARGVQDLIGQKATQDSGARIQRETGAEIFEWIAPDMIVTADYRGNRVRVTYDTQNTITEIACG